MYTLIAIAAILGFVVVFLVWQLFNIIFRSHDPFYSTDTELVKRMIAEFDLKGTYEGKRVYELGCGMAPFLRVFHEDHPKAKCVGVEKAIVPYLVAKIQVALHHKKIKIKRKDIFKMDVSKADLIYCYLDQKTINSLAKKLKFECKIGAKIVSSRFPMTNMMPVKTMEIPLLITKKGHEGENKVFYYEV